MAQKRVYAQDYKSEFILGGQIFKMSMDEQRRPYAEIPEHLEPVFYQIMKPLADSPAETGEVAMALDAALQPQPSDGPGTATAVAEPKPVPAWAPGMEMDVATQDRHGAAARELIAQITDKERLVALRKGEEAHAMFVGGRKGVLAAIDERLAELGFMNG